jgi:hypothetical protein
VWHPDGASCLPIRSTHEILELVARGTAARTTAATGVHEHSSRSHALLTLTLEHRWRDHVRVTPGKSLLNWFLYIPAMLHAGCI